MTDFDSPIPRNESVHHDALRLADAVTAGHGLYIVLGNHSQVKTKKHTYTHVGLWHGDGGARSPDI